MKVSRGELTPPLVQPQNYPEVKPVTVPLGDLFVASANDPLSQDLRSVYLAHKEHPSAEASLAARLLSRRQEFAGLLERYCEGQPESQVDQLKRQLASTVPSHTLLERLQQMRSQASGEAERALVNQMISSQAELKALQDVPYLSADGLVRNQNYYVSASALQQMTAQRGWEQDAEGTPIADVVVVGAGPGGLANAYHLAQGGARVVTLEGGYVGQAFSNAGAQSVHSQRTDRLLTSLIRTGYALQDLSIASGLPGGMGHIVTHAALARMRLLEETGHRIEGLPVGIESTTDWQIPAARAELFEHFQEVGNYLATQCDNSFLIEQSPVTTLGRGSDGLFAIETSKGHHIKARKLVMANGFVKPGGSNSKILPVFQQLAEQNPERLLVLREDADLSKQSERLAKMHQSDSGETLICSDRLLGQPDVQLAVRQLPPGSSVAVVGSGESAAKAAMEVLSQNPQAHVQLFVKAPMESAQVQIPSENMHPVVLERAPLTPEYGRFSMHRYKEKFDTPVTPRTMIEILQAQQSGQLSLYELGSHFDEKSMEVGLASDGVRLAVKSPQVAEHLAHQNEQLARYDLPTTPAPRPAAMVINAAGYDRKQLVLDPLAEQLQAQGLLQICNDPAKGIVGEPLLQGLTSAACPDLAFNTSGALATAADSAIPGMAVRGRILAEHLLEQLPQRTPPAHPKPPERLGADWAHGYSTDDFEGFVHYRGVAPRWVEHAPDGVGTWNQLTFPDPERFLRELANRPANSLTPPEKLTLARGRGLIARMGDPVFHLKDSTPSSAG